MKSLLIILFSLLCINVFAQSDSLFIAEYLRSYTKYHKKMEKTLERRYINKSGSHDLIIIPSIFIKETVKWDYINPANNRDLATWDVIDVRHMIIGDYIIITPDESKHYYQNIGFIKKPSYNLLDSTTVYGRAYCLLLQEIEEIQPDYIFRLWGTPSWFFICGDKIVVIERIYNTLLYYDNAVDYLKHQFTQDYYWPPFYSSCPL